MASKFAFILVLLGTAMAAGAQSPHQDSLKPDAAHQDQLKPEAGHQDSLKPDAAHQDPLKPDAAHQDSARTYLGFDRNDYPGDAALPALRKNFLYTGYWLNDPPGESGNSWAGKRAILKQYGFGFLVLFNGRLDDALKGRDAAALGSADGKAAAAAARREGFPSQVLIFLDQEEGGRLLDEQAAYVFAWIDAVRAAGARAGVYCSGIAVPDGPGTITTGQDIALRASAIAQRASAIAQRASAIAQREAAQSPLALWIAQDECPPSPGCSLSHLPPDAVYSPAPPSFTAVWQYAQSPRRAQFSAGCPKNDASDGNCYAPGLPPGANTFVDLDTASSPDPSEGRP